ncbi:hypothetical protein AAFF_G00403690 [Aldrovandia affinis]|uniref:Uncharacterized protein n=1 Tax=Aldrovandia affinis TaxID=143900 RepID=A0AAD7X0B7_9TELE|nr:hypothetical protein AAFF_G00403690 [Aldrovandia affinis]
MKRNSEFVDATIWAREHGSTWALMGCPCGTSCPALPVPSSHKQVQAPLPARADGTRVWCQGSGELKVVPARFEALPVPAGAEGSAHLPPGPRDI